MTVLCKTNMKKDAKAMKMLDSLQRTMLKMKLSVDSVCAPEDQKPDGRIHFLEEPCI